MRTLTPAILSSVAAYALTSFCAIALIRRRFSNKRLKQLALLIGLMPLLQAASLISTRQFRITGMANEITDFVDLFVSLLCLWSIYLIDKESRDRLTVDVKLRLVESETQRAEAKPHQRQLTA
jgi:hypothetical protein